MDAFGWHSVHGTESNDSVDEMENKFPKWNLHLTMNIFCVRVEGKGILNWVEKEGGRDGV